MMEHGSRTRLTTALVLAVVFASGVLMGFAADGRLGASPAPIATPVAAVGVEAEPEPRTPMYREVGPTEEQLLLIDSIVKEHRARTNELDKAMRATYRQGFREILLETRDEIKSVLGPEQAARYQRLLDEHDARQAAESEQDRKN
jgi:hypothetical protein